jgi:putative phage-type endonuclease
VSFEVLPRYPDGSPEWLEQRRHSIGASDVAAVLGISPWDSPLSIWEQKLGKNKEIDPASAFFGHEHEPTITKWLQFHGNEFNPVEGIDWSRISDGIDVRSVEYPWLTAKPDRLITDANGDTIPVELKTHRERGWPDGVPLQYQAQSQQQQLILDAPYGLLVVLHAGAIVEAYRIDRDNDFLNDYLIPETGRFWHEHVEKRVQPEAVLCGDLGLRSANDEPLDVDERMLRVFYRDSQERVGIKEHQRQSDAVKIALQELMEKTQTTSIRWNGTVLYAWPVKFDQDGFQQAHGDLVAAFTDDHGDTDWKALRRAHSEECHRFSKRGAFRKKTVKELEEQPPIGLGDKKLIDLLNELDEINIWRKTIE